MKKQEKRKRRVCSPYRVGGFWDGYKQLRVEQTENFKKDFMEQIGVINIQSFNRMLKKGTTSRAQITIINSLFADYGITENIWETNNQN